MRGSRAGSTMRSWPRHPPSPDRAASSRSPVPPGRERRHSSVSRATPCACNAGLWFWWRPRRRRRSSPDARWGSPHRVCMRCSRTTDGAGMTIRRAVQRWSRLGIGKIDEATGQRYFGPQRFVLRRGDRVVVDEAGMVDLRSADALASVLEETGAGIAMIGDPLQAAPVGHVGAMALLTRSADNVVELRAVHRFADPQYGELTLRLRNVSSADRSDGRCSGARRRRSRHRTSPVRMLRTTQWSTHGSSGSAAASGSRSWSQPNDDADAISEAIQQRRLDAGELSGGCGRTRSRRTTDARRRCHPDAAQRPRR